MPSGNDESSGAAGSSGAWFEAAFERGYLEVYPHRDLASARVEVGGRIARELSGRVLDLGCGFGRHSLAMLELGLEVYGMDLSADLLASAGALEGGTALEGRLVRGDFRRPPFREGSFDAVVMLFSSFGYFDDEGNRHVAGEVARLLRDGGRAVLDLMNPFRIRARLVPSSRTERGELCLIERRALAEGGRRVQKEVELVLASGERRHWREDVRLYEPEEVRELLAGVGLEVEGTDGEFDGRPFDEDSPRQIVWARAGSR